MTARAGSCRGARTLNPYRVLVSEIMLQQTQVERVIDKYQEFLPLFPDFRALARSRPQPGCSPSGRAWATTAERWRFGPWPSRS